MGIDSGDRLCNSGYEITFVGISIAYTVVISFITITIIVTISISLIFCNCKNVGVDDVLYTEAYSLA